MNPSGVTWREVGNGGVAGGVTGNADLDGEGDGDKDEGIEGRRRCVDGAAGVFGVASELGVLPFDSDADVVLGR